jgi:hypothetical protein
MKRATILLLALMLVPAARADAKFSSARVCGPSDCREVDLTAGHTVLAIGEAAFSPQSQLTSKPPEAFPWYRVTLCPGPCESRNAFTLKVLPAAGYEYLPPKEEGPRKGWAKLDQQAADVYRSVTKGLEPFAALRLVALGAEDPGSSGQEGTQGWAWIAIPAAAATFALLSLRWLRRPPRSPSVH